MGSRDETINKPSSSELVNRRKCIEELRTHAEHNPNVELDVIKLEVRQKTWLFNAPEMVSGKQSTELTTSNRSPKPELLSPEISSQTQSSIFIGGNRYCDTRQDVSGTSSALMPSDS